MARTKQTARRVPSTAENKKRKQNWLEDLLEKKRKVLSDRKEFVKNNFPCDLLIVTTTSESSTTNSSCSHDGRYSTSNTSDTPNLDKLKEHVCGERCFDHLPKVNWSYFDIHDYYSPLGAIFGVESYPYFASKSNANDPGDIEYTMHILNEAQKVKDEELSIKVLKCETMEEGGQEVVTSVLYEYTKCGMKCYYKRYIDEQHEFVMLFLGKDEYLCFGHCYNFPYYLIPYVNFGDENNNNASNFCDDDLVETIVEQDQKPKQIPILLPLSKVLANAEDFLRSMFED